MKKPTKNDYERHLNDHPIKSHPEYKVWLESISRRHDRWGAWLRETRRKQFDILYADHIKSLQ